MFRVTLLKFNKMKFLFAAVGLMLILVSLGMFIFLSPKEKPEAPAWSQSVETSPQDLKIQDINIPAVDKISLSILKEGEDPELIRTETVVCNDEVYIFDVVSYQERTYFFNDIYKNYRSPENFIVRLKAPRGGEEGAFMILATPKVDCDRIYLTTFILKTYEPVGRIFEWRIGEKTVRELSISQEFWEYYVMSFDHHLSLFFDGPRWLSPGHEKILVAHQNEPTAKNERCDYRTLRLLRLRDDKSELVAQLPRGETFDNGREYLGRGDLLLLCDGFNFGWIDESTIFYDVFDKTKDAPSREVKSLVIE